MIWQTLGPNLPQTRNRFTKALGRRLFRRMGWRIDGEFPDQAKVIVAVAPHSSNIDWVLSVAVIWGLGLRASYLVKHSLFRFPLGPILTALGGIPVERGSGQGLVQQLGRRFGAQSQLVLGITPEGTRGTVRHWKMGFAHIAQAANVPVLPTILDYRTRTVNFHPLITDVSNADTVMSIVQAAAATGQGKRDG
jgi:1-acyl-sn-glycerol-3-phosphate acyltransferase